MEQPHPPWAVPGGPAPNSRGREDAREIYNPKTHTNVQFGTSTGEGWRGARFGKHFDAKASRKLERGLRYQDEVRRILEADEWLVHVFERQVHRRADRFWTASADLWGAVDMVAMCRRRERGLRFVQVTRRKENVAARRRKLEQLPWTRDPLVSIEIWERRLLGEDGHRPPGQAPGYRLHVLDVAVRTWAVPMMISIRRPHQDQTGGTL